MQCSIVKTSPAVYQLEKDQPIKLSAAAAAVLVRSNAMRRSELKLYVGNHRGRGANNVYTRVN